MTWALFLGGNVDVLSLIRQGEGSDLLESNINGLSEMVMGVKVDPWMFYASHGFSFMPPEAWRWAYAIKGDYRVMMGRKVNRIYTLAGIVSSHPVAISMGDPKILPPSWGMQAEISLPLTGNLSLKSVKIFPMLSPRVGAIYYPLLKWEQNGDKVEKRNVLRLYVRTIIALGIGR